MNGPAQGFTRPRLPVVLLILIAFAAGAVVMIVELAAARILTPFFGQSVFVWTNVIGVILAALAAGNYLGGRLADSSSSLKPLFGLLALAGGFCLLSPMAIGRVAHLFLGENLQLEEAFPLLIRGSFVTTLFVFAPPVLLLGTALPFVVSEAARSYGRVGRASGSVYAASTLGSILGTFLTTYFLIETFGSRGTFFLSGAVLMLLSGIGIVATSRRTAGRWSGGVLIVATIGCAFLVPDRAASWGRGVIWAEESRYQYLRVVEAAQDPRTLYLCVNEGIHSFESIYREGDVLSGGQYYDFYTLLPCLAGRHEAGDVCIIGLAAGTIARQYAHFFGASGALQIDGVEIDPAVIEAGYRYMDLAFADPWLNVFNDLDGRVFLNAVAREYDVIIIDAYSQQIYIPFHLATEEFFALVEARLRPGGILGINVSGFRREEPVIEAIANTAAKIFGSVTLARIPEGRNFMLYTVKGQGHVAPRDVNSSSLPKELKPLLAGISAFGSSRAAVHDPRKPLLQDDHAPLEIMSDRALAARSQILINSISGR